MLSSPSRIPNPSQATAPTAERPAHARKCRLVNFIDNALPAFNSPYYFSSESAPVSSLLVADRAVGRHVVYPVAVQAGPHLQRLPIFGLDFLHAAHIPVADGARFRYAYGPRNLFAVDVESRSVPCFHFAGEEPDVRLVHESPRGRAVGAPAPSQSALRPQSTAVPWLFPSAPGWSCRKCPCGRTGTAPPPEPWPHPPWLRSGGRTRTVCCSPLREPCEETRPAVRRRCPGPNGGLENQEIRSTTSTKPIITVKTPPATISGIILLDGLMRGRPAAQALLTFPSC